MFRVSGPLRTALLVCVLLAGVASLSVGSAANVQAEEAWCSDC
jgi:hypothetical protein